MFYSIKQAKISDLFCRKKKKNYICPENITLIKKLAELEAYIAPNLTISFNKKTSKYFMAKKESYLRPEAECFYFKSCLCIMDSFSGEGDIDQFELGDELNSSLDEADGYGFSETEVF